jgi:predicted transposase/invertase (TIGR01784 family)
MEHNIYDKTLKELFSRPEIVKNFMQGFVGEEFVNDIDFNRIEKKNTSYITKTFKNRYTDLVIKLNMTGGKCAYLYILFEFQSTIDKLMPLRILNYMLLLYEDLIKQKEISIDEPLPPVFPVVLYTGTKTYNASTKIEDLIALPYKRLQKYVPTFEHHLVTLNSKPREELKKMTALDNMIAGLFYLLTAGTEEEIKEAEKFVSDRIDYASEFGRFYVIWIRKYLKHRGIKIKVHTKEGGKVMLETVVANIRAEGKFEGKFEGKQEDILKILRKKFKEIPQSIEYKITNIYSVEKLEEVLLAILDVTSIGEVEKIINT